MAQLITTELDEDGIIRFKVDGVGEFCFDPLKATDEVRSRAMIHGFVQKISDKAALGRDPDTGRSASPEDKFAAMKAMADRLAAGGEWNARREAGAGAPTGGLLVAALCRLYPHKGREQLAAYVKGLSKAAQGKVRATARVAEQIAAIRAERAKSAPDNGDELLAELDGLDAA